MLGTRLQFGNVRGEDRFYIPVKARKRYNQQQKQSRKAKNDVSDSPKVAVSGNRSDKDTQNSLAKPSSDPSLSPSSNLDRFLESTTPSVPAQYFSKVDLYALFTSLFVWMLFNFVNIKNTDFVIDLFKSVKM